MLLLLMMMTVHYNSTAARNSIMYSAFIKVRIFANCLVVTKGTATDRALEILELTRPLR